MSGTSRGAILRRAIETCIRPDDDAIAKLGELFHDDVTVWSPNMLAVGLADLTENLAFRELTFSDVDIQIDALHVFANKGFAEFRVTDVRLLRPARLPDRRDHRGLPRRYHDPLVPRGPVSANEAGVILAERGRCGEQTGRRSCQMAFGVDHKGPAASGKA